jgi:26S proteasome regulatory subunit N9
MADASSYLSGMKNSGNSDLAEKFSKVEELYNKKLWHQLTILLKEVVKLPAMQEQDRIINLYTNFIQDLESKINPLSLVMLANVALEQHKDAQQGIDFIQRIGEKVKSNVEAGAMVKILVGKIKLHKFNERREVQDIIEEVDKMLAEFDGVSQVHCHFYLLSSDLYRIEGKHAEFYRSSLRYLGCTDTDDLTMAEQTKHAFFLSLAALMGDGVFNFGELLAHKVLNSLKGTENEWLIELLFAFNSGDVSKFRALKPKWSTQPDLTAHETVLFEKVCLLCLMEMTFRREATQRILTFQDIAKETTLPVEQVELLIMKALSQGLVQGKIDQVSGAVDMTWVQPRVLDKQQVKIMTKKIESWSTAVSNMELMIENQAGEILTY